MDIRKASVIVGSPAIFSIIGMVCGHLYQGETDGGPNDVVIIMTIAGAVFGLGLAGLSWLLSTGL